MVRKFQEGLLIVTGWVAIALFPINAEAGTLHQIDDGVSDMSFGIVDSNVPVATYDILWLNSFITQAPREIIRSISLAWGTPTVASGNTGRLNGLTTEVLLYSDPNNDGNPEDAVLLTSALTTVTNQDTDIFTRVNITPTQVSGNFFVAALMRNLPLNNAFPATFDSSSPLPDRSWLLFTTSVTTPGIGINVDSLSGIRTIESFSTETARYNGNWLLRAQGRAVPAVVPSPVLLPGLLALGLGVWHRHQGKREGRRG
jgi:hypothetical protein